MHNLNDIVNDISTRFGEAGIAQPRREAKYLIGAILELDKTAFFESNIQLNSDEFQMLESAVDKRLAGCPISKIIGKKSFWRHDFVTSEHVLDPRPDTETLIEAVLNDIDNGDKGREYPWTFLDLGTGSGCIITTLLYECPNASAIAVDISDQALGIARQNAIKLGVENRLVFYQGSWCEAVTQNDKAFKADIVVSNPPYIPSADITNLDQEVQRFDPILALDGGKEGGDCYQKILAELPALIRPQSLIYFEIGVNQKEMISRLVEHYGFAIKNWHNDLSQILRVVTLTYPQFGGKLEKNKKSA